MREALGEGGTSFDALYVNVNGESGYFDRSLNAYGREGEPCDGAGRRSVGGVHEPLVVLVPEVPADAAKASDSGYSAAGRGLTKGLLGGTLEDGPLFGPAPQVHRKAHYMAKALIGYRSSDLRDPRQAVENARLRAHVAELETLVLR